MKLIYISILRFPSEKIQSGLVMRSCEKFAERGMKVELWIPRRFNKDNSDPFGRYGSKRNFTIKQLPVLDLVPFLRGNAGFSLLSLTFNLAVLVYAWMRGLMRGALFYTHGPIAVFLLAFFRPLIFMEIHELNKNFKRSNYYIRWLFSRVSLFLATNKFKTDFLHKEFHIPYDRIIRQPNAVNTEMFGIDTGREEARKKLGLPLEEKIVLYTGMLTDWKGADIFLTASELLTKSEVIYVAGGTDKDISEYKQKAEGKKHLVIVGRKPHQEIPLWLRAADVLVLPHTAKFAIAKYDASPVKLFEYLASGRPVVISDLPSMREIVDDSMVWFFAPDNPQSLADSIHQALAQGEEAEKKALRALAQVNNFSWDKWADNVVAFINNNLNK